MAVDNKNTSNNTDSINNTKAIIETAKITWTNKTPNSSEYNDIYFSPEGGLAESQYVFIDNNNLIDRWSLLDTQSSFTIAETGFGTGLNFLAACQLWNKNIEKTLQKNNRNIEFNPNNTPSLHFISFEKHPLSTEDIEKALTIFPELKKYSQELLTLYPKITHGFHRLHFSNNVHLTLIFDNALNAIKQLDCKVDAWFFDGFSPSNNDDLWSTELFQASKKLNHEKTTFSTFTAAGHVKRKLQSIGFNVEKIKGFGKKRDMLRGICINSHAEPRYEKENVLLFTEKPWLIKRHKKAEHETPKRKELVVIGAGLAGAWTAYKFAMRGWEVKLYDEAKIIASGASGNPRGATYFKPSLNNDKASRFYFDAYLYSTQQYQSLFPNEKDIWDKSGLLQLSNNTNLIKSHKNIAENSEYSQVCEILNHIQSNTKAGVKVNLPSLFFPDAGSIDPVKLCEHLLSHSNIHIHLNHKLVNYYFEDKLKVWTLRINNHLNETIDLKTSYLILANSYTANQFSFTQHLPLHSVRGQTTHLESNDKSKELKTVICASGYLTPSHQGQHCIGSTFDPKNNSVRALMSDNMTNLSYLKASLPGFYDTLNNRNSSNVSTNKNQQDIQQNTHKNASEITDDNSINTQSVVGAKAALRCQTPDNLPIVGQAPDYEHFAQDYAGLSKGQLKRPYPLGTYHSGLYLNVAHGSRGLISAPYCAELLVNEIEGSPLACSVHAYHELSASRFYIRQIRKPKT